MRFRPFVLGMILLAAHPLYAAADLLTNVRAADVLSNVLTYAVDRTDAANGAMQTYLRQVGKADEYARAAPAAPSTQPMSFSQVTDAAIRFVRNGGDRYADPALRSHSPSELMNDLTALQSYNLEQFQELNRRRQACESLRAYLKSIDQWEKFLTWAKTNAPDVAALAARGPTTQPAPQTPDQLAEGMANLFQFIHDQAWQDAQARGVNQADFDRQWLEEQSRTRQFVAQRVQHAARLGGPAARHDPAGTRAGDFALGPPLLTTPITPMAQPGYWMAYPPADLYQPPLPPPVPSMYTREYFQRQNDQNWYNRWDRRWYDRDVPLSR